MIVTIAKQDDDGSSTPNKIVRVDELWMLLFSLTSAPNFKKLICFLYSLPCSNAYVESVFSQMKHLFSDSRNCMSTELVSAELKIRLNSTLSCTEKYKYILSNRELLKAIQSDEKYTFKNNMSNYLIYFCLDRFFFFLLYNKDRKPMRNFLPIK